VSTPLLLGAALAATQADIELVRPTFGAGAPVGMDSPLLDRDGTLRVGASLQYLRDPLILYKFSTEEGAVVSNRDTLVAGFTWQPARMVALRAALPLAAQWGGEIDELSADGVGTGNFSAGLLVAALRRGPFALGFTGDLFLPTGGSAGWMGDGSIRFDAAALGRFGVGPFALLAELGTALRPPVTTGYDFTLGSELNANAAARWDVWPSRFAMQTGLLYRGGYEHFFVGEAENPLEWIGGIELRPWRSWQLDLSVGRGLSTGYGTSQFRGLAALTWVHRPVESEPPPRPTVVLAPVEELTEAEVEPDPPPPPEDPPLARIEQQQIVIRDPIQFEFGTDRILPVSQPTLEAIKDLLDVHPELLHVVIEGHASEEGSYIYNYDLSLRRSLSIFRALVDVGVHPARLSCRGMGEVVPTASAVDEATLAANRRVIFHIVRQLEPGEPWPDYGDEVRVPWTGDARKVKKPPPRAAPPPPPTPPPPRVADPERADPDQFTDEDDDPLGAEPAPTEPTPAEPAPADPAPSSAPPPAPEAP